MEVLIETDFAIILYFYFAVDYDLLDLTGQNRIFLRIKPIKYLPDRTLPTLSFLRAALLSSDSWNLSILHLNNDKISDGKFRIQQML